MINIVEYNFRRKNEVQILCDYKIINTVRNNFRMSYLKNINAETNDTLKFRKKYEKKRI